MFFCVCFVFGDNFVLMRLFCLVVRCGSCLGLIVWCVLGFSVWCVLGFSAWCVCFVCLVCLCLCFQPRCSCWNILGFSSASHATDATRHEPQRALWLACPQPEDAGHLQRSAQRLAWRPLAQAEFESHADVPSCSLAPCKTR